VLYVEDPIGHSAPDGLRQELVDVHRRGLPPLVLQRHLVSN
jgi:hypothetical protein